MNFPHQNYDKYAKMLHSTLPDWCKIVARVMIVYIWLAVQTVLIGYVPWMQPGRK
jgi:hypothetical protein